MNTLAIEIEIPLAVSVQVTDDALSVDLSDGRTIFVPLGWYPRLEYATQEERENGDLLVMVTEFTGKTLTKILALRV